MIEGKKEVLGYGVLLNFVGRNNRGVAFNLLEVLEANCSGLKSEDYLGVKELEIVYSEEA
jgi:hypothetical protein